MLIGQRILVRLDFKTHLKLTFFVKCAILNNERKGRAQIKIKTNENQS